MLTKRMEIIPAPLKNIRRRRRQTTNRLLHRAAFIRVRPRQRVEHLPRARVVVVHVVVREGRELGGLGDDLPGGVFLVFFGFEDVDFGRAAADVDRWAGVVGAGAGTGAGEEGCIA